MLNVYEVKLPKDKDDLCRGNGLWCGYCKCCEKLFKYDESFDDINEWRRERCYIWAEKWKLYKTKVENEAKLEAVDDIKYWAFKIGFPPGFDPQNAFKLVKKATSSHGWDKGIWNVEFFSSKHETGGNLHFHLLQPKIKQYKRGALIKHLAKTCKIEENFVEYSKNGAPFRKQVEYICGLKTEDKLKYVELDREWREKEGFPHISLGFPKVLHNKYKKEITHALR